MPQGMPMSASAPQLGQKTIASNKGGRGLVSTMADPLSAMGSTASLSEEGGGAKWNLLDSFTAEMQVSPASGEEVPASPATRQARTPFQASGISPLVRAYLRHPSQTAGRPPTRFSEPHPFRIAMLGGMTRSDRNHPARSSMKRSRWNIGGQENSICNRVENYSETSRLT